MAIANQQQINIALSKIKNAINNDEYGKFHFRRRPENEKTLIKLGFLHSHVLEEILSLTYRNYCNGPEPNLSRHGAIKGTVWIFGKVINELEVYIKIHIVPNGSKNQCICISFHEANQILEYPYAS